MTHSSRCLTLYVYPPEEASEYKCFIIGPSTDPTELQHLISTQLGYDSSTILPLHYYDEARQCWLCVPYSSIYDFFCCMNDDDDQFSVRVIFPTEHESEPKPLHLDDAAGCSEDQSWENQNYFSQYSKMGIHYSMLSDMKRCEKYKEAIDRFGDFEGKVVMDVGCGTGFLSILAAKAGAKRVFAIEASSMWENAQKIVEENGCSSVVTVIHSQVELLQHLPDGYESVDIIISEWMGVFLLYESMLESVIFARDRWLKPDGCLYPAEANLYVAPICWKHWWDNRLSKLENVCGINTSYLKELACSDFSHYAFKGADGVLPEHVLDKPSLVQHFDLKTLSPEQYRVRRKQFEGRFSFNCTGDRMDGFVTWFDVVFKGGDDPETMSPVVLSTTPHEQITHWKQDVFLMGEPISVTKSPVNGQLKATQSSQWRRHYEAHFSFTTGGVLYEKGFLL